MDRPGAHRHRLAACLLAALCAGSRTGLRAQQPEPPAPPARRWHLTASGVWVTTPSGWRSTLLAVLPSSESCGAWACQRYPHYTGGSGTGAGIAAGYAWRPWLELRGIWIGSLGMGGVDMDGWQFEGRLTAGAVVAALTPGPVRLGVGPAVYSVSVSSGASGGGTKLGWLWEVGLRFPQRSRILVDLAVQRRAVGELDVEVAPSYTVSGSFSHTVALLGLGVRW